MARLGRPGLSDRQKSEIWDRWRTGEGYSDIGRAIGKHPASIFGVLRLQGGYTPAARSPADSYAEALDATDRAVELWSVVGLWHRGVAYDVGYGVEPNGEVAPRWYREAAEQGYAPAQTGLGSMYSEGRDGEQRLVSGLTEAHFPCCLARNAQ